MNIYACIMNIQDSQVAHMTHRDLNNITSYKYLLKILIIDK